MGFGEPEFGFGAVGGGGQGEGFRVEAFFFGGEGFAANEEVDAADFDSVEFELFGEGAGDDPAAYVVVDLGDDAHGAVEMGLRALARH